MEEAIIEMILTVASESVNVAFWIGLMYFGLSYLKTFTVCSLIGVIIYRFGGVLIEALKDENNKCCGKDD